MERFLSKMTTDENPADLARLIHARDRQIKKLKMRIKKLKQEKFKLSHINWKLRVKNRRYHRLYTTPTEEH